MILKVSGNVERNAVWTYEDIDDDAEVQKEHQNEFKALKEESVRWYPYRRDTLSYQI